MKILGYDCFSGISGDMHLGALVDLGVPKRYIEEQLRLLPMADEFRIFWETVVKQGIRGTQCHVVDLHEQTQHCTHEEEHKHHHAHHEHRTYAHIAHMIEETPLSENIKTWALRILRIIGEAEAQVHGKSIEEVHFHEVGAVDSIVDIVGAAIGIDYLQPDMVVVSPVVLGSGTIQCAHGIMPIPAPATALILRNVPIVYGGPTFECTTPTGAAIIKAISSHFDQLPTCTITRIGYGFGTYQGTDRPNALRLWIGESTDTGDDVCVLSANIDDMSPECYESAMDAFFQAGALDVWITPMYMKKMRPAHTLQVMCNTCDKAVMEGLFFTHTSTIGVRSASVDRHVLDRTVEIVTTPYGEIPVKVSTYEKRVVQVKPEYDVCRQLATEQQVSVMDVQRAAVVAYEMGRSV